MKINGIHHVGLYVTDEQRSLEFYRDKLGGKVVHSFSIGENKNNHLIDLGGGAIVELVPVGAGKAQPPVGWAHIAVAVDDTQAAYDEAIAAGATTWMPPSEMDLGKKMFLAYVYGPDNEIIEFYQEL
jgi:catechol 2,3-dioxygenase-like lactoylglutathione lyase family enzyme